MNSGYRASMSGRRPRQRCGGTHSVAITQWPLCSRLSRLQKQLCGRTDRGRIAGQSGPRFCNALFIPSGLCAYRALGQENFTCRFSSRFTLQQQSSFPARKVARGSRQSFSFDESFKINRQANISSPVCSKRWIESKFIPYPTLVLTHE